MSKKEKDDSGNMDSKSKSLDSLKDVDNIWVEVLLSPTDMRKQFSIRGKSGELLFYGSEKLSNFVGQGRGRRFHLVLLTPNMKEVLNVVRKEIMIWFCCFCGNVCMEQLRVSMVRKDKLVGTVDQVKKCSRGIRLDVMDAKGKKVLQLRGPSHFFACCGLITYKFDVLDLNGKVIGRIARDSSSTFAHNYQLSFPATLDLKIKAVLLGVCFMLVSGSRIFSFFYWTFVILLIFQCFRNDEISEESYGPATVN